MAQKQGKEKPLVLILMGSDSDMPIMKEAAQVLEQFGVAHEITVASAHRSPDRATAYAREAAGRGLDVIIAGAGGAAHLAGVVAAHTTLPVIAVPLASSPLAGFDALLSSVQMPPGVPVAVTSVGAWGARNAGLLAVQIIARREAALRPKLEKHKETMAAEVERKAQALAAAPAR